MCIKIKYLATIYRYVKIHRYQASSIVNRVTAETTWKVHSSIRHDRCNELTNKLAHPGGSHNTSQNNKGDAL